MPAVIQLRDYQESIIGAARSKLMQVRRVLIQAPTGAGKTALASFMASQSADRGADVWFICHRAELVLQTSLTFRKFGIPHSFIASGYPSNLRDKVQICSIDTLKGRLAVLRPPKLAIVDEAHHGGAAGWAKVIAWLADGGARIVGLSATPLRGDGLPLSDHFDDIVLGPTVAWLMEHGHLSRYRYFGPPPPAELKARGKDDGRGAQAKVMDTPKLTGDIVKHWLKEARGLRTIGFACNVKHSMHMVDAFNAAGIPSAHLDGDTPKTDRKRIIQDFAAGRIKVLWNVALFGEGFDLAAIAQTDVTIDCVILARKTNSLSLFLQMVGRALRPYLGKIAVILDHAGNLSVHGYPDDDHEWSLDGSDGQGKGAANDNGPPPPVICEGCFNAIKRPLPPACPHCGKSLVAQFKPIEVAEGELVEQTEAHKSQVRAQLKREQAEAKSLQELVALGQRRGYKSPMAWANHIYSNRRRA